MTQTIDMKCMRQLNLFERITGVRTKSCFTYNRTLIFAVPQALISKAIGSQAENIKRLSSILGQKIRVIALPKNNVKKFILDLIAPIKIDSVEDYTSSIEISASTQSKAALIGRNKTKLEELKKITKDVLGKELRVI
ncbi:MAG: hypothetical protein NT076_05460 [Candidatus Pacearchaeota archaeon]|nr:hypothetical protein [Candidatus Pacearchaeota archaeon]